MIILGISYLSSRNTSACIIKNGSLVAFSEEERFNRIKHAPNMFPLKAIEFCLNTANITLADVDKIAIGQDGNIQDNNSNRMTEFVSSLLSEDSVEKLMWYPHHNCHAISSIIPSKFETTNYMTSDGFGDSNAGSKMNSTIKLNIDKNILSTDSVNLASTIQSLFEKYISSYLDSLMSNGKSNNLCLAGGSFLNCTSNGKISKRTDIDKLFIQPASNDSGCTLGAAILCHKEMTATWPDIDFDTAYWGSEFDDLYVEDYLIKHDINYQRVSPYPSRQL
jgi:predicted NodU family carbamoyl transferase